MITMPGLRPYNVMTVAFSPDGKRIAAGSWDGKLQVWPADGLGEPILLHQHKDPSGTSRFGVEVYRVAFSPDGTRVVSTSEDIAARISRVDGSGEPVVLRAHDAMYAVAFTPDGTRIVTGSEDSDARIWPADGSGEPVFLRGHMGDVFDISFSPDGTRFVTASLDGTARVWSADSAESLLTLRGHEDWVLSAAFSPDGTRVVTASRDNTARVWNVTSPGLLGYLRKRVRTCLTPQQRRKLLAETTSEAWDSYASCEHDHGREPVMDEDF
jgi:WD40 repeat protein